MKKLNCGWCVQMVNGGDESEQDSQGIFSPDESTSVSM